MPCITINGARLYYELSGSGERTLLFLHGNTASSRMFRPVLPLYEDQFRTLLIDLPGHGKSGRLPAFPYDLWYEQSVQAAALLDRLGLDGLHVLGTSGGALVAINLAMERPDLVRRVIADSFEGERALDAVAESIEEDRERSKADPSARAFWEDCHGNDWESVVDNDTRAMLAHHSTIGNFFHHDVSALTMPVLLTASLEDEFADMARFAETYAGLLSRMPQGNMHLFPTGGHPAVISNGRSFSELAAQFFR